MVSSLMATLLSPPIAKPSRRRFRVSSEATTTALPDRHGFGLIQKMEKGARIAPDAPPR
jgi:hypothetical protein